MDSLPALDFALRFCDGRGLLGLGGQTLFDLVRVERLDLEVPALRFPFDISSGTARFQSRRCHFHGAELQIPLERLQAWLARSAGLARFGVTGLRLRAGAGALELYGRARVGEREAAITAKLRLGKADDAHGSRLVARLEDVRNFAFLPVAAPLLGLGIALSVGAERAQNGAGPALLLRGLGDLECDPLALLLWRALPPSGWRLPSYRHAHLSELKIENGAVVLRYPYAEDGAAAPEPLPWTEPLLEAAAGGDALLADGNLEGALEAYRAMPAGPLAGERQLAVLASLPHRFAEARALGEQLVATWPDRPFAWLALGAVESELGDAACLAAAQRYQRAAELCARAGERDDAAAAAARAGELLLPVDPAAAAEWLGRALGEHPEDEQVAARLAGCYVELARTTFAVGKYGGAAPAEMAGALERACSLIKEPRLIAHLSVGLGALRRDRLGDAAGARRAYREAVAATTAADGPLRREALRSLAVLELAAGDRAQAETALFQLRGEGAAHEVDVRLLGELLVERGAYDGAREVLGELEGVADLLARALEGAGRHAELVELLALEAGRRMPAEARDLYMRAGSIAATALADPIRAVDLYARALPLGPADAELWARLGHLYAGPLAAPESAAECYARAYAADRNRTELLLPLARFHQQRGEWEPAHDYYQKAIVRNAVPPDELAVVMLLLAEPAASLPGTPTVASETEVADNETAAVESEIAVALARGEQLLAAGAEDEAQQAFLEVLTASRKVGHAHAAVAKLYRRRGDLASALEHLIAAADSADLKPARAAACALEAADVFMTEGDPTTAERLYLRAAALLPDDRAPVEALGRLAAARGDHERHSELLARAAALTADRRDRARLLLERAELLERELGREHDAYACYQEAAACDPTLRAAAGAFGRLARARDGWQTAASEVPSDIGAQLDGRARPPAVEPGAELGAYAALRTALHLLPLDAVDKITEARVELGRVAERLGDLEQAERYFELVLAQDPTRREVMEQLVQLYLHGKKWEQAAELYRRLACLSSDWAERAEFLYRRGEAFFAGLGDLERASDAYLKAADLCPTHAPTLRRLISYYYAEGDHASLIEVTRELESLKAGLEHAALEAGVGTALGGDEARGTVLVAAAQPTADQVAAVLARAHSSSLEALDAALRAGGRALGSGDDGRRALIGALERLLEAAPGKAVARLCLARLYEHVRLAGRAHLHYAVLAFVDRGSLAAARLSALPPPEPLRLDARELIHPSARGPLRDALTQLGPLIIGLPSATIDAEPAPEWAQALAPLARAAGLEQLDAAVVEDLLDPAWAEPTRPPRLLLARRVLADPAVARFAAVRALHALTAGVSLVEGRAADEVAALLEACAAVFSPGSAAPPPLPGSLAPAWQADLEALPLLQTLPDARKQPVADALAACLATPSAIDAAAYAGAERLSSTSIRK